MRGGPIVQWLLLLLAWSALAIPIHLVTSSKPDVTEAPVQKQESSVVTWLNIRFSSPPASFAVSQENVELWRETDPEGSQFEKKVAVVFDEFGAELHLRADLVEGTSAIEIRLEPDARAIRSKTIWADGDLDEFVTFSWDRND